MTQSVGPEYGLDPLHPELHETIVPPINSRNLVSTENYRDGTEFGGVAGLIQPPPHTPTASERLHMIYAIDPEDDGTRGNSVLPPELEGNFGSKVV